MSSHLDLKQIKAPDAFQENAKKVVDFTNTHLKLVIGLAAIFAVGGMSFAFYSSAKKSNALKSSQNLYLAKKSFEKDKSAAQLEQILEKHPNTTSSVETAFILGDEAFAKNEYSKAIEYYLKAEKNTTQPLFKSFSYLAVATSYENLKDFTKAEDFYQKALSLKEKSLRGETLLSLARVQKLKGDTQISPL